MTRGKLPATKQPSSGSTEFKKRVDDRLKQYGKDYKIEDLNESNDRALLMILIRSELLLEDLQLSLQTMVVDDIGIVEQAQEVKKISDLIRDMTTQVTTIQKTLSIDRKSRRDENELSVAEYIKSLKRMSKDFIDQRMIRVWCDHCKVMVARLAPVHDHTSFTFETHCSQCDNVIVVRREGQDVWFDVKDADWRRKYQAEIIHPESDGKNFDPLTDLDDTEIVDMYSEQGLANQTAWFTPSTGVTTKLEEE